MGRGEGASAGGEEVAVVVATSSVAGASHALTVIARLDRAIQYSEAPVIEPRGRGVLDSPPEPVIGLAEGETRWRGMTAECVAPRYCAALASASSTPRFSAARAASRCSVVMWLATMRMAVASTAASSVKPRIGITSGTKSNGRMK